MSDEPIVVKTFSNETEAEMAQQLLDGAGVRAFVFKDDAGGMEPQLQASGGVRLMVRATDAERARDVIKKIVSD